MPALLAHCSLCKLLIAHEYGIVFDQCVLQCVIRLGHRRGG
jgi:hypothetical protein